jgi:hypothetical protein
VRIGMFRLEGQGPPDQVDGGVAAACLRRYHTEKMQAVDVIGIECTDLPVKGLGLGQPAGLVMRERRGELLGDLAPGRRAETGGGGLALARRSSPLFSVH